MKPYRKHYRLFPFSHKLDFIHRSVVACVESPSFEFALPQIPNHVLDKIASDRAEAARLGFVGDAHIASSIAAELRRCYPGATPHFYTVVRSVLVANSTFAHLMKKVGLFKDHDPVKPAGDAFEAILAAFYAESGPEQFQAYVKTHFFPLIITAGHAYKNSHTSIRKARRYFDKLPLPRPKGPTTGKIAESTKHKGSRSLPHPLSVKRTGPVPSSNTPAIVPVTMDLTTDMDSEDERAIVMLALLPARGTQYSRQVTVDHPQPIPTYFQPEHPFRVPMNRRSIYPIIHPGASVSRSYPNTGSSSTSALPNNLALFSQLGNNRDNPIVLD